MPFPKLLEDFDLETVLNEAETQDWPALQIAGQVLFRCSKNCPVAVLAVITFLSEQFGPLGQGELQAFRDLANILKNQPNLAAITSWLETHYG
jgi:hypothetical protein